MVCKIPLYAHWHELCAYTVVNEADFPLVSGNRWHLQKQGYAARGPNYEVRLMHRLILPPPPGYQVDHINGDRLDNRRENLRLALPIHNSRNKGRQRNNTTGYKGVCFDKRKGAYVAHIHHRNKQYFLGRYTTATAAYEAYCRAATRLHGEYANLGGNEPYLRNTRA